MGLKRKDDGLGAFRGCLSAIVLEIIAFIVAVIIWTLYQVIKIKYF